MTLTLSSSPWRMTPSTPRSIPFVAPIPPAPATKTPSASPLWPKLSHVVNSPPRKRPSLSPAGWSKERRKTAHAPTALPRPAHPARRDRCCCWSHPLLLVVLHNEDVQHLLGATRGHHSGLARRGPGGDPGQRAGGCGRRSVRPLPRETRPGLLHPGLARLLATGHRASARGLSPS